MKNGKIIRGMRLKIAENSIEKQLEEILVDKNFTPKEILVDKKFYSKRDFTQKEILDLVDKKFYSRSDCTWVENLVE